MYMENHLQSLLETLEPSCYLSHQSYIVQYL